MAAKKQSNVPPVRLLHWTERVKSADANDPLGLALRVGARLANQLLHCITSITPRARYFSFLCWCIQEYTTREHRKPGDRGLREAVRAREKALILGCVLHHEGMPCAGGALVGTKRVKEWFDKGIPTCPDFISQKFSTNPALGQYLGSLVNLGALQTTDELEENDESADSDVGEDEGQEFTLDDLRLGDLGELLASCYDHQIHGLKIAECLALSQPGLSKEQLSAFGKTGGFCELSKPRAADRELLRKMFFNTLGEKQRHSESHARRASTLILLLELGRQLDKADLIINVESFYEATMYDAVIIEEEIVPVQWPESLHDIKMRWQFFHFHQTLRFGLEGLLGFIAEAVNEAGTGGIMPEDLLSMISLTGTGRQINAILGLSKEAHLWNLPLNELWERTGFTSESGIKHAMSAVSLMNEWYEDRENTKAGALLMFLLILNNAARLEALESSPWANWLSKATEQEYLDVSPLTVLRELRQRFGNWREKTLGDLAGHLMMRFVIEQHLAMAFTKNHDGSSAFFCRDGERLRTNGNAKWQAALGNARLRSALTILSDLGYQERTDSAPTQDGLELLTQTTG